MDTCTQDMFINDKAAVINNQILTTLQETEYLKEKYCQICSDDINSDNYVTYKLSPQQPWCLALTVCSTCLDYYIQSQNAKISNFVQDFTDLKQCSKTLKLLLNGQYGIPTHFYDPIIFPPVDNQVYPNHIDPLFGRKNQLYQISIGKQGTIVDPLLSNAPQTVSQIRQTLIDIVNKIYMQLTSYISQDEISTLVSSTTYNIDEKTVQLDDYNVTNYIQNLLKLFNHISAVE